MAARERCIAILQRSLDADTGERTAFDELRELAAQSQNIREELAAIAWNPEPNSRDGLPLAALLALKVGVQRGSDEAVTTAFSLPPTEQLEFLLFQCVRKQGASVPFRRAAAACISAILRTARAISQWPSLCNRLADLESHSQYESLAMCLEILFEDCADIISRDADQAPRVFGLVESLL